MPTQEKIRVGSIVQRPSYAAVDVAVPTAVGVVTSIPAAPWMGADDPSATVYWFTSKECGWHSLENLKVLVR